MIEDFIAYKSFLGKTERVIVTYFPPHVAFTTELLESGSEYLSLKPLPHPGPPEVEGQPFMATIQLEIKVHNGGAIYWLADADEHGVREGVLDKLIPGLEAESDE